MIDDCYVPIDGFSFPPPDLSQIVFGTTPLAFGFTVGTDPLYTALVRPMLALLPDEIVFIKTEPGETYEWHIDNRRLAAINTLLTGGADFHSYVVDDDDTVHEVPYRIGRPVIYNTSRPHKVVNANPYLRRIVCSIGYFRISYEALVDAYRAGKLLTSL